MGYSTNTTKNLNFERILIWIFFLYIYIKILEKQITAINHLVAKYINYIIIIIFTYILLLGQQCYKSFSSKVQIKKIVIFIYILLLNVLLKTFSKNINTILIKTHLFYIFLIYYTDPN